MTLIDNKLFWAGEFREYGGRETLFCGSFVVQHVNLVRLISMSHNSIFSVFPIKVASPASSQEITMGVLESGSKAEDPSSSHTLLLSAGCPRMCKAVARSAMASPFLSPSLASLTSGFNRVRRALSFFYRMSRSEEAVTLDFQSLIWASSAYLCILPCLCCLLIYHLPVDLK